MPRATANAAQANDRSEHRWIMRACLLGKTPGKARELAKNRVKGIKAERIRAALDELAAADITRDTRMLTVNQAAVALGVIPRRVRLLCQEGRLGTQVGGGPWIIMRDELIEYLGRQHKNGQAGRDAAEADKMAVSDRYGEAG